MNELQEILPKIQTLFFKYGVRSVTMDDIARELGKSKKTLYKFFQNKDDIVSNIVNNYIAVTQKDINGIVKSSDNALDEWLGITNYHFSFISKFNPSVIFDIKKYYPHCWSEFEAHKLNFVYNRVLKNLKRGIAEQFYRDDLNTEIIARFYIYKMEMFADNSISKEVNITREEIYDEIMNYHLRGISSDKGIEYLNQLKLTTNEKYKSIP